MSKEQFLEKSPTSKVETYTSFMNWWAEEDPTPNEPPPTKTRKKSQHD